MQESWEQDVASVFEQYRDVASQLAEEDAARARAALEDLLTAIRRARARASWNRGRDTGVWVALWRAREVLTQGLQKH